MTIVMQFVKCSRSKMYNKKQVCQEVVPRSQPKVHRVSSVLSNHCWVVVYDTVAGCYDYSQLYQDFKAAGYVFGV